MCLGPLVIITPPSIATGGYLAWRTGEQLVLDRLNILKNPSIKTAPLKKHPQPQTFQSYTLGVISFVSTYAIAEYILSHVEGNVATTKEIIKNQTMSNSSQRKSSLSPPKIIGEGYIAPQTVNEWLLRFGKPVALRVGAISTAFFCAGIVQTYVANKYSSLDNGISNNAKLR